MELTIFSPGRTNARPRKPVGLLMLVLVGSWAAEAKLNIIATTPDLAAIARSVGGDRVEITTLVRPTEDAHFIDAKPSFIVKLNRADALIEGGAELESGWLPALLAGARNPKLAEGQPGRISARIGIQMLEVPEKLDRSQGDLNASGNPHYLIAPSNARMVAATLAQGLSQLDPAGAEIYQAAMRSFQQELDTKLASWKSKLSAHKGRQMIAYHNSWIYFATEFELKVDHLMEPKPGVPPSASRLGALIKTIQEEDIRIVLAEPYLSRRLPETLSEKSGIRIVPVSQFPGGIKGTDRGYIELLDTLVTAIAEGLSQPLKH